MTEALKPGDVLSETYRLVEIIGQGGMGQVWRAEHLRLPKEVAIKVLVGAGGEDDVTLARFRREAEIASRLGHANIVEVLDWNELPGGVPYMVMELLAGESLRQRIKRGPLPLPEAARVLRQVASALQAAHDHGVVHRDLKPENIHLVPEPGEEPGAFRAKVLDFGISKVQGRDMTLTQESEVLGTPVYMAPEQAAGRLGAVGPATDQFALAAIAYELLGGAIAFSGQSVLQVLSRILEDEPRPLRDLVPGLPEGAYAAVERGLRKRPEERFPSVTAFVEAVSPGRASTASAPAVAVITSRGAAADADLATGPTRILRSEPGGVPGAPVPAVSTPVPTPVTAAVPGPGRSSLGLIVFGSVMGAVVAVVLTLWLTGAFRRPEAPPRREARAAAPPGLDAAAPRLPRPDAAVLPAARPDAAPSPVDAQAVAVDAAASRAPLPPDPRRPAPRDPGQPGPRETDPGQAVGQDLSQGAMALARGNHDEALAAARRSLRTLPTPGGYFLLVKTYCAMRDLRNANAMLQNLPKGFRTAAIRYCKQKGLDLGG